MLREILRKMTEGEQSFTGLALSLGISTKELRNRLEILEKMGYIHKASGDQDGESCTFCPTARECAGCSSDAEFPDTYHITPKGERLLE